MAGHEERIRRLILAIDGVFVEPVKSKSAGPINYFAMDTGTRAIASPTLTNLKSFEDFLLRQERDGHLSRKGPKAVACEAGSPGAHWTFNAAPVAGVLLEACKRGDAPGHGLRSACVRWLGNEAGLNRKYRFRGEVWFPCPRVKNEKTTRNNPKGQPPWDGYRDVATDLLSGVKVRRPDDYWQHPQAIAVRTIKALLELKAENGVVPLAEAELEIIQTSGEPKLYMPIQKQPTQDGGYLAWIEETPEARACMGRDCCNWVLVGPGGATWGVDWEPLPEIKAA
jgi:hypothetical protein